MPRLSTMRHSPSGVYDWTRTRHVTVVLVRRSTTTRRPLANSSRNVFICFLSVCSAPSYTRRVGFVKRGLETSATEPKPMTGIAVDQDSADHDRFLKMLTGLVGINIHRDFSFSGFADL